MAMVVITKGSGQQPADKRKDTTDSRQKKSDTRHETTENRKGSDRFGDKSRETYQQGYGPLAPKAQQH
jgi:hypothetical protein